MPTRKGRLTFAPVTPERWGDLERLFGPRGGFGGCWCMWWRSILAPSTRGRNLAVELIEGAVADAGRRGAGVVEAYPHEVAAGQRLEEGMADFMGTLAMFERAGFEVAGRAPNGRPVVRRRPA